MRISSDIESQALLPKEIVSKWFQKEIIKRDPKANANRKLGIFFSALSLTTIPIFAYLGYLFGKTINQGKIIRHFLTISGGITTASIFAFPSYYIGSQALKMPSETERKFNEESKTTSTVKTISKLASAFTIGVIACIPLYYLNNVAFAEYLGMSVNLLSASATLSGAISWMYPLIINSFNGINFITEKVMHFKEDENRINLIDKIDNVISNIAKAPVEELEAFYDRLINTDKIKNNKIKEFFSFADRYFPSSKASNLEYNFSRITKVIGGIIGAISGYVAYNLGIAGMYELFHVTAATAATWQVGFALIVGITGATVMMGNNLIGNAEVGEKAATIPRAIINEIISLKDIKSFSDLGKKSAKWIGTTIFTGTIALMAIGAAAPQVQLTFEYVGMGSNPWIMMVNVCTAIGTFGVGAWGLANEWKVIKQEANSLLASKEKALLIEAGLSAEKEISTDQKRADLTEKSYYFRNKVLNMREDRINELNEACR
jgi:hypothetical protein